MKKIVFTMMVVFAANTLSADTKKDNEVVILKKIITTDICTITYTVRETVGNTTTISDYTISATTCEEVESIAVSAGIIKLKKATVE